MATIFLHGSLPALWPRKRPRTEYRRSSPPPSAVLSQDEEDCALTLLMLSRAPLVLHGGVPPLPAPKQQLALPPQSSPPPTMQELQPYPLSFPGIMLPLAPPTTPSTVDLCRYRCSECGKGFSSYQALGGHKSSHHRKRPAPSPQPEKRRNVKARRAILAMPSTSLECSPKKGLGIDLNPPVIIGRR